MKKINVLFVLLLFFAACQSDSGERADNSNVEFFDIPAFFENEIENFAHSTIKKTVVLNDKQETQELTDFDIEKELQLFKKIKIDKPSWRDKFSVAQAANSEKYIALDDKMSVREVEIDKVGEKVIKIKITTRSENTAFDSAKTMIYEPSKGFSVEKNQDVALIGNNMQKIIVEFL